MRPIYNKDMTKRVVFERNGTFIPQRHNGSQGTKTNDPWEALSAPMTSLEQAKTKAGLAIEEETKKEEAHEEN